MYVYYFEIYCNSHIVILTFAVVNECIPRQGILENQALRKMSKQIGFLKKIIYC